jgi:heat shock protein HslJ
MRIMRIGDSLALAFFLICLAGTAQETITVTGTLTRAMAIGGESTGWSIQLDSEISIGGKQVQSVEVEAQGKNLEALNDKHVRATGKVSHRQGVERGDRIILAVSSIREIKAKAASGGGLNLANSEWVLKDLAGSEVMDSGRATLAFAEGGKVSGHGSCNRFFGTAKIEGQTIHFGPLGSTRMACAGAVMDQETKYLNALQAAERFEWKDPELVLYCKGYEKPLRFTRAAKPQ